MGNESGGAVGRSDRALFVGGSDCGGAGRILRVRGDAMRRFRVGAWAVAGALVAGLGLSWGQNPSPTPSAVAPSSPAATVAPKKRATRRTTVPPASSPVQVIPLETAPPSPPPSPAAEARQKAEDQRLLEQQKRESAQAAEITNKEVEKAQKQQESVQKEVRIQDAPGPAQTGVVPAAGPPVAPASGDQRIQDAPGPAQTLPPPQPQPANPPQG